MRLFSNIKVILLCAIVLSSSLYSQNLSQKDLLEFYPYNIGNSWSYWWIYYNAGLDYYEAGRAKIVISKDTVVNDLKYWLMQYDNHGYEHYTKYLERIDTTTGDVFRTTDLSTSQVNRIDNLYANVGDTVSISNNRDLLYCDRMVIKSIRDSVINDFPTTIREVIGIPYTIKLSYARKIGFLGSGKNFWIDSAKVDGMIFSHITDIHDDGKPMLTQYVLHQNYPNPFNPVTTINYSLNKPGFVTLKIYDLLGREVKTLVSGEQLPGHYSIKFNGSDFASGVYFYQLRTNEFVHAKKMLLLK